MKASTLSTLALLFVLAFALGGTARHVYASSTFNVTKTADTNDGVCDADCSLREAIGAANATASTSGSPNIINVPAGTYSLTLGELVLGNATNQGTSIVGAGSGSTIIRQSAATCSSGTARVFDLDPSVIGNVAVSISGVTISNGAAQAFGGGAILGGGTNDSLNLSNSIISNNCTTGFFSAAGISWSPAGNVTISNTTFSNNVSGQAGGAILYTSTGTLNITNSTFTGNTAGATGSAGGAILLGTAGTFNINSSTFTNNQATNASGIGGAIYLGGGTLNLGNTTANRFVGNTAGVSTSGGLGVRGGTANATNNWWGCNGGPGTGTGCDKADNSGGTLNFTPWVVLTNTPSPNPILVNQATTLSADFLHNSSGGSLTTSQISVLIGLPVTWGSAVRGTIASPQATIQSNGTATATFTANAAGAGSAAATVDNGTATANITINKANTTTSITSDTPDPSVTGQSVTVNFSVSSSTGNSPTAPTGNVTVSDGTDSCTDTVATGSCMITFGTTGNKTLTATYAGDSNFNSSSSAGEPHTVTRPNQPPTANADTYPALEDQALTVNAANGVLKNDTDPDTGDTLTAVKVGDPSHGTLTLNSDGSFSYTPGPNFNGSDSFSYKARDSLDAESSPTTVTINVTAVNNAPAFTKGPNVMVRPDAGPYSAAWATAISAGPADESGQTLTFQVTGNTNPGLFSAGPALAANGTLTFTPAPNADGSATITVVLKDNGGTANGGVDTSAPQSFTITITSKWFVYLPVVMVQQSSVAHSVAQVAAISADPTNEGSQTPTFQGVGNPASGSFSRAVR